MTARKAVKIDKIKSANYVLIEHGLIDYSGRITVKKYYRKLLNK